VRHDEGSPESELCQPGSVACCEAQLPEDFLFHPLKKTFGFFDKQGRVENVQTQKGGRNRKVELRGATRIVSATK